MARSKPNAPVRQNVLQLKSLRTLTDDLAFFGRTVGPRRGSGARTKGQKEDYCLRRWLIAMALHQRIAFPVLVEACSENEHLPDFLLKLGNGEELGVEVTEAGAATWQQWLSQGDSTSSGNTLRFFPTDGYVGDEPERLVIHDVLEAIRRKSAKHALGAYQAVPSTDLLIYENSEGGLLANHFEVVESIRSTLREQGELHPFRQAHLIFGDEVFLDIAGPSFEQADVSKTHADDWSAWLQDQARLLRQRNFNAVDADNLAEELDSLARSDQRALKSQIRRLLIHLLKWATQPAQRSKSWRKSIQSAREQIDSLLEENPSFENRYLAGVGMNVAQVLPSECPFTVDSLRDPDFLPEVDK